MSQDPTTIVPATPVPAPEMTLREYADHYGDKLGVPKPLRDAIFQQESGFEHYGANGKVKTSPKGALGVGQLMPGTARDLGVDPNDPIANLNGSLRLQKRLYDKYLTAQGGDTAQAAILTAAAYNSGEHNVDKHGGVPPFAETQNYVKQVANHLRKNPITGAPTPTPASAPFQPVTVTAPTDAAETAPAEIVSTLTPRQQAQAAMGQTPAPVTNDLRSPVEEPSRDWSQSIADARAHLAADQPATPEPSRDWSQSINNANAHIATRQAEIENEAAVDRAFGKGAYAQIGSQPLEKQALIIDNARKLNQVNYASAVERQGEAVSVAQRIERARRRQAQQITQQRRAQAHAAMRPVAAGVQPGVSLGEPTVATPLTPGRGVPDLQQIVSDARGRASNPVLEQELARQGPGLKPLSQRLAARGINLHEPPAGPQPTEGERFVALERLGLNRDQIKALGVDVDAVRPAYVGTEGDKSGQSTARKVLGDVGTSIAELGKDFWRGVGQGAAGLDHFYAGVANLASKVDPGTFWSEARDGWLEHEQNTLNATEQSAQSDRFERLIAGRPQPGDLDRTVEALGTAGPTLLKYAGVAMVTRGLGAAPGLASSMGTFGLVSAIDNGDKPVQTQVSEFAKNIAFGAILHGAGKFGGPGVRGRVTSAAAGSTAFTGAAALQGQPLIPAAVTGAVLGAALPGTGEAETAIARGGARAAITPEWLRSRLAGPGGLGHAVIVEDPSISPGGVPRPPEQASEPSKPFFTTPESRAAEAQRMANAADQSQFEQMFEQADQNAALVRAGEAETTAPPIPEAGRKLSLYHDPNTKSLNGTEIDNNTLDAYGRRGVPVVRVSPEQYAVLEDLIKNMRGEGRTQIGAGAPTQPLLPEQGTAPTPPARTAEEYAAPDIAREQRVAGEQPAEPVLPPADKAMLLRGLDAANRAGDGDAVKEIIQSARKQGATTEEIDAVLNPGGEVTPPTAEAPRVPERAGAVSAQLATTARGDTNRSVTIIPPGQTVPTNIPSNLRTVEVATEGQPPTTVFYSPERIGPQTVEAFMRDGRSHELTGLPNPESPEATVAGTARAGKDGPHVKKGDELWSAYLLPGNEEKFRKAALKQFEEYEPTFEFGGKDVEAKVLEDRTSSQAVPTRASAAVLGEPAATGAPAEQRDLSTGEPLPPKGSLTMEEAMHVDPPDGMKSLVWNPKKRGYELALDDPRMAWVKSTPVVTTPSVDEAKTADIPSEGSQATPTLSELAARSREKQARGELTSFEEDALINERMQLRRRDEELRQKIKADEQRIADGNIVMGGGIAKPITDEFHAEREQIAARLKQINARLSPALGTKIGTNLFPNPPNTVRRVHGTHVDNVEGIFRDGLNYRGSYHGTTTSVEGWTPEQIANYSKRTGSEADARKGDAVVIVDIPKDEMSRQDRLTGEGDWEEGAIPSKYIAGAVIDGEFKPNPNYEKPSTPKDASPTTPTVEGRQPEVATTPSKQSPQVVIESVLGKKDRNDADIYLGEQQLSRKDETKVGHMFNDPLTGSTLMLTGEVTPEAVRAKVEANRKQAGITTSISEPKEQGGAINATSEPAVTPTTGAVDDQKSIRSMAGARAPVITPWEEAKIGDHVEFDGQPHELIGRNLREPKARELAAEKGGDARQVGKSWAVVALLKDEGPGEPHPVTGRRFSSTQVDMPPEIAKLQKKAAAAIPDSELAEDGRESDAHLTVKYGLHTENPDDVRKILADEPPIKVTIGKVSIFPANQGKEARGGAEYDVVKMDVDSPDLHRLNAKIAAGTKVTDTHPVYKPHMTLAYVKPGEGAKYDGTTNELTGKEVTLDKVLFSSRDGREVEIPLTGKPEEAKDALSVGKSKKDDVGRAPGDRKAVGTRDTGAGANEPPDAQREQDDGEAGQAGQGQAQMGSASEIAAIHDAIDHYEGDGKYEDLADIFTFPDFVSQIESIVEDSDDPAIQGLSAAIERYREAQQVSRDFGHRMDAEGDEEEPLMAAVRQVLQAQPFETQEEIDAVNQERVERREEIDNVRQPTTERESARSIEGQPTEEEDQEDGRQASPGLPGAKVASVLQGNEPAEEAVDYEAKAFAVYTRMAPAMHERIQHKNAARMAKIINENIVGDELLAPKNKMSRAVYEEITGRKIPKGEEATAKFSPGIPAESHPAERPTTTNATRAPTLKPTDDASNLSPTDRKEFLTNWFQRVTNIPRDVKPSTIALARELHDEAVEFREKANIPNNEKLNQKVEVLARVLAKYPQAVKKPVKKEAKDEEPTVRGDRTVAPEPKEPANAVAADDQADQPRVKQPDRQVAQALVAEQTWREPLPFKENPTIADLEAFVAQQEQFIAERTALNTRLAEAERVRDKWAGQSHEARVKASTKHSRQHGGVLSGMDVPKTPKMRENERNAEAEAREIRIELDALDAAQHKTRLGHDMESVDYGDYLSAGLELPAERRANYEGKTVAPNEVAAEWWREAFDQADDPFHQSNILQKAANMKSTPQGLSDILDRVEGLWQQGLGAGYSSNVAHDVGLNKAATPAIKARADRLYEEIFAPTSEDATPTVEAKPSRPPVVLTEKQRKVHNQPKGEKTNAAGFTKTQAAYIAKETEDYAHERIEETYGKDDETINARLKEGNFPITTLPLSGEPETIHVPGDGQFTIRSAAEANRLHQKVTGQPIEGIERAKGTSGLILKSQPQSPRGAESNPSTQTRIDDLIQAFGGEEKALNAAKVTLKQHKMTYPEDDKGRDEQENIIAGIQRRLDDKRDPEEVKAPFARQVNALIEKQSYYKELRDDVIKAWVTRNTRNVEGDKARVAEYRAEQKRIAEGFSPEQILSFHAEDPKSVVGRRINFNQTVIWQGTDIPRSYKNDSHGEVDWFRIEAEAKEGIGKFTAEAVEPKAGEEPTEAAKLIEGLSPAKAVVALDRYINTKMGEQQDIKHYTKVAVRGKMIAEHQARYNALDDAILEAKELREQNLPKGPVVEGTQELDSESGQTNYSLLIPKAMLPRRIGDFPPATTPKDWSGERYILSSGYAKTPEKAEEKLLYKLDFARVGVSARSHDEHEAEMKSHDAAAEPLKQIVRDYFDSLSVSPAAEHSQPEEEVWDPAKAILISADSIEELRRSDVDRVLNSVDPQHQKALGDYIIENRPDLAKAVRDAGKMTVAEPEPALPRDEIEVGDDATVNLAGRDETVTISSIHGDLAYFDYFGTKSRPLSEMTLKRKSEQNLNLAKHKTAQIAATAAQEAASVARQAERAKSWRTADARTPAHDEEAQKAYNKAREQLADILSEKAELRDHKQDSSGKGFGEPSKRYAELNRLQEEQEEIIEDGQKYAKKPKVVAEPAASDDPNIGRTWSSDLGTQTIKSFHRMGAGDYYEATDEKGNTRIYQAKDLDERIKADEHRITPEYLAERDNRQQEAHEQRRKEAGKKIQYLLEHGDSSYDITKAEHDYAAWLVTTAPKADRFRMWRYAEGGLVRHAQPGKRMTAEQAQDVLDALKQHDITGRYIAESGTIHVNRSGMRSEFNAKINDAWEMEGSAAIQSEKADVQDQKRKAERDDQLAARTAETNERADTVTWIESLFGKDILNSFNTLALAKFLRGETKKFDGLANAKWKEGLEKHEALTADGEIDYSKLKAAYDNREAEPTRWASTYQRTTPAPGTPERAASEQARKDFDKKTEELAQQESDFKEKAANSKNYSKVQEQWKKKAEKADDQLQQVYKEYEAQRKQWRAENLEDTIVDGDEANSMSALAILNDDSKGLYDKVKALGIAEAKRQGATDEEVESAAISASSMIMSYPGTNRAMTTQIETELRVANQKKRISDARATIEALPDLSGKSDYYRRLEQTYGDVDEIERVVDSAKHADEVIGQQNKRAVKQKEDDHKALLKKIGPANGYFVRVNKQTFGEDFLPVHGEPLKIRGAEDVPLFLHRSLSNPDEYAVSEATTGFNIGKGKTEISAKRDAAKTVEGKGRAKFKEAIQAAIEKQGASPWVAPETEEPESPTKNVTLLAAQDMARARGIAINKRGSTDYWLKRVREHDAGTVRPEAALSDVGEKIGGARKDLAESAGTKRTKIEEPSDEPSWRKRWVVSEIVAGKDEGRWAVSDIKKRDRFGGTYHLPTTFATKADAEAAIPLAAVSQKHVVYQAQRATAEEPLTYGIYRKIGDRRVVQVIDQKFETREDAMRYMAQHAEQILDVKTSFGEEILPKPETVIRKGAERRTADATPQQVKDTFGFRAVEFGNWNNQIERQEVVNHAYDALIDLAEVLNIPPKAIGLNGELALAFGARGHGLVSARAHYERDYGVMNLTKMSGAGSLAHEWFHSLDHYFGRVSGKAKSEKLTNKRGDEVFDANMLPSRDYVTHGFPRVSQARPEIKEAYDNLIKTMFKKAEQYTEDSAKAEKFVGETREEVRKLLEAIRDTDYNALSKVAQYGNKTKPASAEQLAEFDVIAQKMIDGEFLDTHAITTGTDEARRRGMGSVRWSNEGLEKLSAIYKAVRGRSGFSKQGGVFNDLSGRMGRYSARLKMLSDAQSGAEKTKQIPTSFAMEAKSIDQGRTGEYWLTPHEMAARAFQAYVEDKLSEQGGRNDFLSYGTHMQVFTPWGWKRPYPTGEERVAINKAFDKLVDTLQTKETEKGTALYALGDRVGQSIDDYEGSAPDVNWNATDNYGKWTQESVAKHLSVPADEYVYRAMVDLGDLNPSRVEKTDAADMRKGGEPDQAYLDEAEAMLEKWTDPEVQSAPFSRDQFEDWRDHLPWNPEDGFDDSDVKDLAREMQARSEETSYPEEEFSFKSSGFPPIVVTRRPDGKLVIEDGNHRADIWGQNYEVAPAWVNDEQARQAANNIESPQFRVEGNRIYLENHATDLIAAAMGQTSIGGMFVEPMESWPVLRRGLRAIVRDDPDQAEDAQRLLDAITEGVTQHGSVRIATPERMQHEVGHGMSYDAAQTYLNNRHTQAGMEHLASMPQWEAIERGLRRLGYPVDNRPVAIEEAYAHIMEGRYKALGLTEDEALEWLTEWFTSFRQAGGNISSRAFAEASENGQKARTTALTRESRSQDSERGVESVSDRRADGPTQADEEDMGGEKSLFGRTAKGVTNDERYAEGTRSLSQRGRTGVEGVSEEPASEVPSGAEGERRRRGSDPQTLPSDERSGGRSDNERARQNEDTETDRSTAGLSRERQPDRGVQQGQRSGLSDEGPGRGEAGTRADREVLPLQSSSVDAGANIVGGSQRTEQTNRRGSRESSAGDEYGVRGGDGALPEGSGNTPARGTNAPTSPGAVRQTDTPEQRTIADIDSRVADTEEFHAWLSKLMDGNQAEIDEAMKDGSLRQSYVEDFVDDEHSIRVRSDGLLEFYRLWNDDTREIIGDLPVLVHHHTSDAILSEIRKRGLARTESTHNAYQNSRAGVYVTTEVSGPAIDGYQHSATSNFGGNAIILGIKTDLDSLEPDPDDADITSGATQFILPHVSPQDIVEITRGSKTEPFHPSNPNILFALNPEEEQDDPWADLRDPVAPETGDEFEEARAPVSEFPTGVKNAVTERERNDIGAAPIEREARRSIPGVFEMERDNFNPIASQIFVQKIVAQPRNLSPEETAQMTNYKVWLLNEYARAGKTMAEAQDSGDTDQEQSSRIELIMLDEQMDQYHRMAIATGYEWGLTGNMRKVMLMADYSIAQVRVRARALNYGPLDEATEKKLADLVAERDAALAALEAYDAQASQRAMETELRRRRMAQQRADRAAERAEKGIVRKQRRVIAKSELKVEFADLSSQWRRAMQKLSANPFLDPELYSIIGQMVENLLEQGANSVAEIVDPIYKVAQENGTEGTERELRDAISGYGKIIQMSKEEIDVRRREIKSLMRDATALEVIEQEHERPARTGFQRDKMSQRQRESHKRITSALRKYGIEIERNDDRPLEERQQSALDAMKTHLRNRIEDLKYYIGGGERGPKFPGPMPDSEAQSLMAERDHLQEALNAMTGPMTDDEKIALATKAVERAITEYERKIGEGDIAAHPRMVAPWSVELGQLQQRRAKLQKEIADMRKAAAHPSKEQRALEASLKAVNKSITDLEDRIKTNRLAPKPKAAPKPTTPVIEAAKAQRAVLQKVLADMRRDAKPKAPAKTDAEKWAIRLKILKTVLTKRDAALDEMLRTQNYTKKPRPVPASDPEVQRLRASVKRKEERIDEQLKLIERANDTGWQKFLHTATGLRRAVALSSTFVLGKLTNAALARIFLSIGEEIVGAPLPYLPGIGVVARQAASEGYLSLTAEMKHIAMAFSREMVSQAAQVLRTGKTDIDVLYGKKKPSDVPDSWYEFIGHAHAMLKTPAKLAAFERFMQKNLEWLARHGYDPTTEPMKAIAASRAVIDANRAILQQDNVISDLLKSALKVLEAKRYPGDPDLKKGQIRKYPTLAAALRFMFPVTRVPPNFIFESMNYVTPIGLTIAALRFGKAIWVHGLTESSGSPWAGGGGEGEEPPRNLPPSGNPFEEGIPPDDADAIIRGIKKAVLGSPFMVLALLSALGFINFIQFGGYYRRGEKRKKEDVQAGGVRIFGWDLPTWATHIPLIEAMQVIATSIQVYKDYGDRGKDQDESVAHALFETAGGIAAEIPFYEEPIRAAAALEHPESGARYLGGLARGFVVPPDVQRAARIMDSVEPTTTGRKITEATGFKKVEAVKRKPEGGFFHRMGQEFELGVPGLRKNVSPDDSKVRTEMKAQFTEDIRKLKSDIGAKAYSLITFGDRSIFDRTDLDAETQNRMVEESRTKALNALPADKKAAYIKSSKQIDDAVARGDLLPDDPDDIGRDAQLSEFQIRFKRKDIKEALRAYKTYPAANQAMVKQFLIEKGPTIDNLKVTEQEAVKREFQQVVGEAPRTKVPHPRQPKWTDAMRRAAQSASPPQ